MQRSRPLRAENCGQSKWHRQVQIKFLFRNKEQKVTVYSNNKRSSKSTSKR